MPSRWANAAYEPQGLAPHRRAPEYGPDAVKLAIAGTLQEAGAPQNALRFFNTRQARSLR